MPKTIITRNPQKPLFIRSADEFSLKADYTRPIGELSLLERGLLFAELSLFAYLSVDQFELIAHRTHFDLISHLQSSHGETFVLQSPHDIVITCRGTGERDWEELQSGERSLASFAETIGKVHRCFKSDVDELWPKLESDLAAMAIKLPIWFCGHSLGAALANISAQRCLLSYVRYEPEELHTFGSPRIGNRQYTQHVPLKHYRWVNNNDTITRVPSAWLGYRHGGQEMYLDREGKLSEVKGWRRIADRLQGALKTLFRGKLDHSEDHSIIQYVDRIFALVRAAHPLTVTPHVHSQRRDANPSVEIPPDHLSPTRDRSGETVRT